MQKFYERKNPKINIKKKVREVTQSRYVQAVASRFRTPSTSVIIKTSIAFIALGVLTVSFPTEEGPTLQVAISLIITMYFIYDRLKSKLRAFLYGAGSFILSWLLGTFLMVSVMPPILKGPRSLEGLFFTPRLFCGMYNWSHQLAVIESSLQHPLFVLENPYMLQSGNTKWCGARHINGIWVSLLM
ncbi:UNVERIFIED_CONTAM: hypothetical protein Sradi_0833100 [Sesamum radiatum]|uniref:Uncharacterized protein n=1 Tax=Sesamum radiatum TaxID=300843 RepID=A0AAW2VW54_SESRA